MDALRLGPPAATEMITAGENAARQRMNDWTEGSNIDTYNAQRDRMDLSSTSRLSQDLRWGLISPNELVERAEGASAGRASFVSEVCWREFYFHVLWHNPRVTKESFQKQFASLQWNDDRELLAAWEAGRTGYPVVDAAMRQLITTGWMHNRARMIVASFLTKDLLIDWRHGERFFMRHLVDGDLASNNGGWQWAASTGTDPQPYFRIFNPMTQGSKFDPDGEFVRRWLPALADVPTKFIHEPWNMPLEVQQAIGCVIGRDYPAPIVDHAEARQQALRVYGEAKAQHA
jgi:deoxyribodipyrimidine photo-lyase